MLEFQFMQFTVSGWICKKTRQLGELKSLLGESLVEEGDCRRKGNIEWQRLGEMLIDKDARGNIFRIANRKTGTWHVPGVRKMQREQFSRTMKI